MAKVRSKWFVENKAGFSKRSVSTKYCLNSCEVVVVVVDFVLDAIEASRIGVHFPSATSGFCAKHFGGYLQNLKKLSSRIWSTALCRSASLESVDSEEFFAAAIIDEEVTLICLYVDKKFVLNQQLFVLPCSWCSLIISLNHDLVLFS